MEHASTNAAVPNINRGNTRNAARTTLTYDFNPWSSWTRAVTYTARRASRSTTGAFPIKVGGEYMNNPAAPSSADNDAWNVGIIFGKSGKKGTWDLSYTYKWLGANAWWEELVDSDFGAFYGQANSPPNSGFGVGYGSGTNVKGHIVRFAYSPTDSTHALGEMVPAPISSIPFPAGSDSEMNRLQVDAIWKF